MTESNVGPDEIYFVTTQRDRRINFFICLIDAIGFPVGMSYYAMSTLLPVFMANLGAGAVTVGTLIAIFNLLVFMPGLFVVGHINGLPRVRSYLMIVALLERFALFPLFPLTLMWGHTHKTWLLIAVFVCFMGNGVFMGINQPAYWIVVGKCVQAIWRGRLFGFAGGIAGMLGFLVDRSLNHLLSGPTGGFPVGYAYGFLIGFLITTVTVIPLGFAREPRHEPTLANVSHWKSQIEDAYAVWRTNPPFRLFLVAQIAVTMVSGAAPYFVLFAKTHLYATMSDVANYTAITVFAGTFAALAWGAWSDRSGNKIVLVAAAVCAISAGVLAAVANSSGAFYGVCTLSSVSTAGLYIASNNICLEYAPKARDIPLFTSVFNLVTAVPRAAAPLLGGLLAEHSGFRSVFWMSAIASLVSVVLTSRITEPRGPSNRGGSHRALES